MYLQFNLALPLKNDSLYLRILCSIFVKIFSVILNHLKVNSNRQSRNFYQRLGFGWSTDICQQQKSVASICCQMFKRHKEADFQWMFHDWLYVIFHKSTDSNDLVVVGDEVYMYGIEAPWDFLKFFTVPQVFSFSLFWFWSSDPAIKKN